ncbi:hypothetical protein ACLI1A_07245 [Flavobacterium sp. RHBU_3]|uniref:hypothetical protein n=1 Tax=Flavobacterium sp. RHBU_3 TaxID=3391184 RepID=UPI00398507B5
MQLTLEELKDTLVFFSPVQSEFWKENSIVALESQKHKTGCNLSLQGDDDRNILIEWSSDFKRAGYTEKKKYTEKGAEAISFLLATKLTEYDIVEESTIGTGIDYWLGFTEGHEQYDDLNIYHARLEISGILKETKTNNLEKRVKEKKEQTDSGDSAFNHLPAYISIIEFSTPKAHFSKK